MSLFPFCSIWNDKTISFWCNTKLKWIPGSNSCFSKMQLFIEAKQLYQVYLSYISNWDDDILQATYDYTVVKFSMWFCQFSHHLIRFEWIQNLFARIKGRDNLYEYGKLHSHILSWGFYLIVIKKKKRRKKWHKIVTGGNI